MGNVMFGWNLVGVRLLAGREQPKKHLEAGNMADGERRPEDQSEMINKKRLQRV